MLKINNKGFYAKHVIRVHKARLLRESEEETPHPPPESTMLGVYDEGDAPRLAAGEHDACHSGAPPPTAQPPPASVARDLGERDAQADEALVTLIEAERATLALRPPPPMWLTKANE